MCLELGLAETLYGPLKKYYEFPGGRHPSSSTQQGFVSPVVNLKSSVVLSFVCKTKILVSFNRSPDLWEEV